MTLSRPELAAQAAFIRDALVGGRLQDVRVPDQDRVVLGLRAPGRTWWLLLCVANGLGRIHTVERKPKNPQPALAFQGLLRKELPPGFRGVGLVDGERIALLRFGDGDRERQLVVELFGPGGNLVLLDAEGRVLGRPRSPRGPGCRALRGELWTPPTPLPRPDRPSEEGPLPSDQMLWDRYGAQEVTRAKTLALSQALRAARAERRRLSRLRQHQTRDLARAGEPEGLRRRAELLRGSFHLLKRGQSRVLAVDWSAPGTPEVELTVNPALAPSAQVEAAFARVRRAERTKERATAQLARTVGLLEAVQEREQALLSGELEPGPQRERTTPRARPRQRETRQPYRSWWTADGTEIRAGRSAADNDTLTFRLSKGNDVWLHVRGRPGSHVVIRNPGTAPSPALLRLAAQVALVQSGLADGAREEVVWTRVKHLRKAKGMAPGKVLVGQEKVLYLETSRELLSVLRREPR
jgi:predicted ribosome quality control (RQC) complex YloA/Tae2 family protein